MSKEERYTYHCDQYDYVEIIYDNEECEEIDSMKMAEKRLNRQQDKISDLEAKLAVADDCADRYWKQLGVVEDENEKLKQQLAEKDEEIERLREVNLEIPIKQMQFHHNQEKISFAVEKLEKVKEFFLKEHRDEEMDTDYIITKDAGEIADYLLDQIKRLKEMK